MVKILLHLQIAILLLLSFFSLQAQYVWRHKACLPGPGRIGYAFTVGNFGYIIAQAGDTTGGESTTVSQVWMYDPSVNAWTQKNNFPGAENAPTVFVINDTAYAGLGKDTLGVLHSDFWRYNATTDQWTQLTAQFPGAARWLAMTFVIGGKGYVGCGGDYGTDYNDLYEYDPGSNTWTQRASLPGIIRQTGFGIAIGNYGYMGLGVDGPAGNTVLSDSYRYDPSSDSWTQIANIPGAREYPGAFVINDTLYISDGGDSTDANNYMAHYYSDCWRYDLADSIWVQEADFSCMAQGRDVQGGFSLNGHGYIVCGYRISSATIGAFFNDLLEFGPLDTTFTWQSSILGNDTNYCGNFSRTLSVSDSCAVWSNGTTGPSMTIDTVGTYWVRYNDSCGVWADTLKIGPGIPSVSVDIYGDTLKVFGGSTYQWYFNDTLIPGATSNTYVATRSGYYSVVETDSNSCKGASGGQFVTVGIDPLSADAIKVYPNPTVGSWQLAVGNEMIGSIIEIYDDNGRLVFQSEIKNQKSKIANALSSGVYYLRIQTPNGVLVKKLVRL
jgi:N-acetylneuraminic acid mutarotase